MRTPRFPVWDVLSLVQLFEPQIFRRSPIDGSESRLSTTTPPSLHHHSTPLHSTLFNLTVYPHSSFVKPSLSRTKLVAFILLIRDLSASWPGPFTIAAAGESNGGAPPSDDMGLSSHVPERTGNDQAAPDRDATEIAQGSDSSGATLAAESTCPTGQLPFPSGLQPSPEMWRLFQEFVSQQSSNSMSANLSSTAIPPGIPPVMCSAAYEERASAPRASKRFTLKTEPGTSNYQQSGGSLSRSNSQAGSTTCSQRLGSMTSDHQTSFSSHGKKRNRSVLSHSNDDDDDAAIELFTRYDPRSEGFPATYTSNPSFSEAESRHNKIYQVLLTILGRHEEEHDSDIEFIKSRARLFSGIDYPGDIIVGLRGAAGVGKSSLLNSILGIEDAAETGDGHKACAAVAQEFRFSDSQDEASFRAEIEFIPEASRKGALDNYISDFFDHQSNEYDPNDPQYKDLIKPYSTCIEALTSMFCNHEEFQSEGAIKKYMKKFSGSMVATLNGTLSSWLNTAMKSLNFCSDTIDFNASTALELSDLIRPFLAFKKSNLQSEDPQPSLWPMVKVVRQGIVLTDLPGTGDTNRTRKASTNEYIRKVDYTVVVSEIKRSETNESIHDDIVSSYKRTRQGGAALFLTRTDVRRRTQCNLPRDINGINSGDTKVIERLRVEANEANDRLKQLKSQASAARRCGDLDGERLLSAVKEQCELDLSSKTLSKSTTLAKGRTPLAIHCHVEGVEQGQEIKMSVETTGIPELRAHLYGLPAAKKFRALEHQCATRLDNFLCMVEMVCNVTKLKRKEDMEQILLGRNESLFENMTLAFQRFKDLAIAPVLEKIMEQSTTLKRWRKCTNKQKNLINWNTELLKFVARDLEADMEAFENPLETLTPILKSLFDETVDCIQKDLEEQEAAGPSKDALGIFFRTLSNAKVDLHRLSEDAASRLERDLMLLKENMLSAADTDRSFFLDNMKITYDQCFNMTGDILSYDWCAIPKKLIFLLGPKIHLARVRALSAKISNTSKGPFMAINNGARKTATKLLSDHTNSLTTDALKTLEDIHRLFSLNFSTEGGNTPAARAIRMELRHEVILAR
ncbi:uncharacterized protein IWZ02DRAFT_432377 [Phyllosticta citriasiana]|uniref:uncharacterized protein n=1 Tax=Phyllosticta citriasiana TaxID=595635 RepID=UPI0030FD2E6A